MYGRISTSISIRRKGHLIEEKYSGETNLLFELASLSGINAHDRIK